MDPDALGAHLRSLDTLTLLRQYAETLTILQERNVTRSRNPPAGDLAETLVRDAYDGELADRSQKSWDVRLRDRTTLQVKSRVVGYPGSNAQVYSPFRSWEFDRCVFILFHWRDYSITRATDVPVEAFRDRTSFSAHIGGSKIGVSVNLLALPGAKDVTALIQDALAALGHPPLALPPA